MQKAVVMKQPEQKCLSSLDWNMERMENGMEQ